LDVWSVQHDHDKVQLLIDLDPGHGLTVTVDRNGRPTATFTDRFTEWLTTETQQSA
jgi:hypothetical protein